MEEEYIQENGKIYKICITRKRIKNINMRVDKDKRITISAQKRISTEHIKNFAISKIDWIEKQIKYYESLPEIKEKLNFDNDELTYFLGMQFKLKIIPSKENRFYTLDDYLHLEVKEKYINNPKYIETVYINSMKTYLLKIITPMVKKYQMQLKKYKVPMPEIQIRNVKTKWGSCIPSKEKVMFNLQLIKTPIECIEYVVLHEMAHFKYMNHSKQFYSLIEKYMPDWKERRDLLNKKYSRVV